MVISSRDGNTVHLDSVPSVQGGASSTQPNHIPSGPAEGTISAADTAPIPGAHVADAASGSTFAEAALPVEMRNLDSAGVGEQGIYEQLGYAQGEPAKRSKAPIIIGIVVALLIVAGVVVGGFLLQPKSSTGSSSSAATQASTTSASAQAASTTSSTASKSAASTTTSSAAAATTSSSTDTPAQNTDTGNAAGWQGGTSQNNYDGGYDDSGDYGGGGEAGGDTGGDTGGG